MTQAERFLELFRDLETHMRRRLGLDGRARFYELLDQMIDAGDATVKRHERLLRDFASLRNAIVHMSHGRARIIAEPSTEVVADLEAIVGRILKPPSLRDITSSPVAVFEGKDTLLKALIDMKRHDYSQVVVRIRDTLGLITPEGITRWILQEASSIGLLEPETATLQSVAAHEPTFSCRFMKPDQTVDEARAAFLDGSSAPSTRLFAVLVTPSGKPIGDPIGIVTPWDVFEH